MESRVPRQAMLMALLLSLCVPLGGCAAIQTQKGDGAPSRNDGATQSMTANRGEKLASSMKEYIDQTMQDVEASRQLKELDPTGEATERQLSVLRRAKEDGGVSVTDYETARSGYKQCMLDKGYKEIVLLKESNGAYKEAGHKGGTTEQNEQYNTDMLHCGILYSSAIDGVYKAQTGNPNLFKNPYEGTLDCLRRLKVAPKNYKLDDLEHDMFEAQSKDDLILDIYQPKVTSCFVSNGITAFNGDEPLEELW